MYAAGGPQADVVGYLRRAEEESIRFSPASAVFNHREPVTSSSSQMTFRR